MIVALIPDRHKQNMQSKRDLATTADGAPVQYSDVRRPTRGIQLKDDTYATLRVIRGNGVPIPLVNAGSRCGEMVDGKLSSLEYSNFLIQAVTEERIEKQQVVETFGEAFIFFFGERPRVLTVQGVLLNTFDFNWESEWWHNYENYLRGTKCVEHDARVYLTYDETMVSGYIMSTNSAKNSQDKNVVSFVFQLFVTDYTNVSKLGDPNPIQSNRLPLSQSQLLEGRVTPLLAERGITDATFGPDGLPAAGSSLSLVEGLMKSGINVVRSAMKTARNVANLALVPVNYLDNFLGNTVRVPIGFEGAVVFDETKLRFDAAYGLTEDTKIQYTSNFGDNSDEFVTSEAATPTHYASADINFGRSMDGIFDRTSASKQSKDLVIKARREWAANGILPPEGDLANLMRQVTGNPIGLKLVGSARNWLAKPATAISKTLNAHLDAVEPIASTANTVMGSVAVADNVLGAISPSTSQALDRKIESKALLASHDLKIAGELLNNTANSSVNSFKAFAESASAIVGG